jgi:uncharacterized SAM-binding protein YcdF (DUF218 family)
MESNGDQPTRKHLILLSILFGIAVIILGCLIFFAIGPLFALAAIGGMSGDQLHRDGMKLLLLLGLLILAGFTPLAIVLITGRERRQ